MENPEVTQQVVEQAMVLGFALKLTAFSIVVIAMNLAHKVGLKMLGASKYDLMGVINADSKAAAFYHGIRYFSFALVAAFIFG